MARYGSIGGAIQAAGHSAAATRAAVRHPHPLLVAVSPASPLMAEVPPAPAPDAVRQEKARPAKALWVPAKARSAVQAEVLLDAAMA